MGYNKTFLYKMVVKYLYYDKKIEILMILIVNIYEMNVFYMIERLDFFLDNNLGKNFTIDYLLLEIYGIEEKYEDYLCLRDNIIFEINKNKNIKISIINDIINVKKENIPTIESQEAIDFFYKFPNLKNFKDALFSKKLYSVFLFFIIIMYFSSILKISSKIASNINSLGDFKYGFAHLICIAISLTLFMLFINFSNSYFRARIPLFFILGFYYLLSVFSIELKKIFGFELLVDKNFDILIWVLAIGIYLLFFYSFFIVKIFLFICLSIGLKINLIILYIELHIKRHITPKIDQINAIKDLKERYYKTRSFGAKILILFFILMVVLFLLSGYCVVVLNYSQSLLNFVIVVVLCMTYLITFLVIGRIFYKIIMYIRENINVSEENVITKVVLDLRFFVKRKRKIRINFLRTNLKVENKIINIYSSIIFTFSGFKDNVYNVNNIMKTPFEMIFFSFSFIFMMIFIFSTNKETILNGYYASFESVNNGFCTNIDENVLIIKDGTKALIDKKLLNKIKDGQALYILKITNTKEIKHKRFQYIPCN